MKKQEKKWLGTERSAATYLQNNFGQYAKFQHVGESDSTQSDITVEGNDKIFFIEVKSPKSQAGQFVALPDKKNKKFILSDDGNTILDSNTDKIISYMDQHFDTYSTGTHEINMPNSKEVFSKWVVNHYKTLSAKFIIFPLDKDNSSFGIIRLEDIDKYFNIFAKYRIKKSGSANMPKKYADDVINFLRSKDFNIIDSEMIKDNKKNPGNHLFIISKDSSINNLSQKKQSINFKAKNFDIYFSKDYGPEKFDNLPSQNNLFELKKLSNTNNPNVIFRIKLKNGVKNGIPDKEFIEFLRSFF